MPPTETTLLTVEEYAKIKDPPGGRYELHHGKLVFVSYPVSEHAHIQRQLMLILDRLCPGWFVSIGIGFRPLAEYELWAADVGMVSDQRWRAAPRDGWLAGAPDLVVEVLSPSDTQMELNDREHTCFQGGSREFWVVYPKPQIIIVSTPDGTSRKYRIGDEIPLDRFVHGRLAVADVFTD